ncbi:hypothetical protein MYCTH_2120499 [Thermothelomyces thermophilus ATCC 42464]|uniref:Nephrocystin 3-like N-terminal domain-containing protein n=1 Tax=Thermothelomyces thermophilus (strain ATCC 42464 / BCRC 31852 / DSM 1799) TaxID=573729 RepID=G2QMT4_THET4|nr:uncharacterized protein MYCTH_2120499 [Thermothelomyces thermophilus ATCC 42464]AEO60474.1 hypothetical protein MYCTH_2120499 [Thermothelomyces thermophilus ATCC 42464]
MVLTLKQFSGNVLGSSVSSQLLNATYDSIRNWIKNQRMTHLPPEGSDYDKVLAWAQLFIERLHSFDTAIRELDRQSTMAAQVAYGYCFILLELGKENSQALMRAFRFFYTISMPMVNLLERTELFNVSKEIQEQLILALSDLVGLVGSVATHFRNTIEDAISKPDASSKLDTSSTPISSFNLYSTFSEQIRTFRVRCERIGEIMWRYQLVMAKLDAEAVSDAELVKRWLAPEDRVLTSVADRRSLLAHDREELTCLWIAPHLTRFLKGENKILSISGRPGSGKSVLSSVIVEYLQRPILGVNYDALYIPISKRIPVEASARAVAKSVLGQLFEKRIGNVKLLQILCDAHDQSKHASTYEEYDQIMWMAVERALATALPGARELVLVVSGIDEASCDEAALFGRLAKATANGTNVRLITLGREAHSPADGLMSIHMSEDLILDDIMAVIRNDFDVDSEFSQMSEFEQESIVTRLAESSTGSFIWAKLATKRLRRAVGLEKLREAIEEVVTKKPTIKDFVIREVRSPNVRDEARHMLVWLAIANRPLSLKELAILAQIDVGNGTISNRHIDVLSTMKHVQGLVFVQDGLMYLRHGLVRAALLDMIAKAELAPEITDAQGDLVARLLLYIKAKVPEQHKPSVTVLNSHETGQLLDNNPLLDLAVLYWPIHLTKTQDFRSGGKEGAAKAFSRVFPTTITALLLQASLWEHRPTPALLEYQNTITDIYRQLYREKSALTLQLLIFQAVLHRQVGKIDQAASLFFEVVLTGNEFLGPGHTVTIQMANSYLEVTESKRTSFVTGIMDKREQVLLVLVEGYKVQFGETSTQAVSILRQLEQHYRSVHQEQKAQEIKTKIDRSTDRKKPEGGDYVNPDNGRVHLYHIWSTPHEDGQALRLEFEERDELLLGESKSYNFGDLLEKAEKYAANGDAESAEQTYFTLWRWASEEYRVQYSEVWVERNLQTLLSYSKFLHSQHRTSEAKGILVGVWKEYGSSKGWSITETSASLLVQIAQVMKSVDLSFAALSLFQQCEHYYRATRRTETSTYRELQKSIETTSREVLKWVSSSESVYSEFTLEQTVLESLGFSRSETQLTLSATNSLVSLYISQHRWHDASRLLKTVLRRIWPSLFSAHAQEVKLPRESIKLCLDLAGRLADCYHVRRLWGHEENIRVRVYCVLRASGRVDDKLRERATTDLVVFYRRASQTESLIALRQEILEDYTTFYGEQHPAVIKTLWELADLARPRPVFVEYYRKIVRALNKEAEISTPEALPAVIVVARELWSRGMFSDALPYYRTLFATFLKAPKTSPKFQDQEWVLGCFSQYTDCLRSLRVSFSVLEEVTSQFLAQCKALYGAKATITVQVTLILARLYQESRSHEQKAIALYEELLQLGSEHINREEISADLKVLHDAQVNAIKSSETRSEVTSSQLDRHSTVLRERIVSVRQKYGWAHGETLSTLTELVHTYSRQGKTEALVSELEQAVVNIMATETSSTRLVEAASTIASHYMAVNQVQKATELVDQVYSQILIKETADVKKTSQVDLSSRGRESLIFLAQFEHSLRRSSATLTEILADLTTQYIEFEKFRSLISSSSSFLDVSASSARLYHSLLVSGRDFAAAYVFSRFTQWFNDTEAKRLNLMANLSTTQVQAFLHSLLDHLGTHKSRDIVRTVGIIGNTQVLRLRKNGRFQDACDLAVACFHYIAARKKYRTTTMAKLVLTMGMALGGREPGAAAPSAKLNAESSRLLLETSRTILQSALQVLIDLNVNLAKLGIVHLNQLIGLLGEQQNWHALVSLMARLWSSRETQQEWPPSVTFALLRRYILARWLDGDSRGALRATEHIVYNCRRVLGLRDPITLDMSVLLSQLYTEIGQRYQNQPHARGDENGAAMANRYYRKAAAIHENILRVYSDPAYASMDDVALVTHTNGYGGAVSPSGDGDVSPTLQFDLDRLLAHGQHLHRAQPDAGQVVRQHLRLLKLAIQRLGSWPKDYAEYERLSTDVFREYGADLRGVEGVERWDLRAHGRGRAEADDDLNSYDNQN